MHGYNMRQSVCFKVLIQLQDCEFCHLRVNEHLTKYSRYFSVFLLKEKSEQHFFYWWRIHCYGKVFPSCCIITAFLKNKTSLLNTFMSTMSNIIQMWYSFASLVYVAWLARQNHHLLFLSRLKKKKIKISLYVWNLTLAEAMICNGHFKWPV